MKLKKEHPEANDMLMPIVNEMFEACGKHKALIPESVQVAEGERIVITAADTALQEAKAQDLAGKGDKQTMQSYLQAMVLYEVSQQFQDPMPPMVAQNHQFAGSRAQAIRKAITAGCAFAPALVLEQVPSATAPAPALAPMIPPAAPAAPCWQPKAPMQNRADMLTECRRQMDFSTNALTFQDAITALRTMQSALQILDHCN
eukprot:TRINITY_DN1318_c0_g1_i3.p1 TRINITY_DN1318_c0_g1~~TRINITY_DN1318_c0_g1_i3.p1  ORF type:complete len:202 (+),score=25.48 TRINITY_DN1318_c0_g1_i3:248-853(+)